MTIFREEIHCSKVRTVLQFFLLVIGLVIFRTHALYESTNLIIKEDDYYCIILLLPGFFFIRSTDTTAALANCIAAGIGLYYNSTYYFKWYEVRKMRQIYAKKKLSAFIAYIICYRSFTCLFLEDIYKSRSKVNSAFFLHSCAFVI